MKKYTLIKIAFFITGGITLVSCSNAPKWEKAGSSSQTASQTFKACQQEAYKRIMAIRNARTREENAFPGQGLRDVKARRADEMQCMRDKGYKQLNAS